MTILLLDGAVLKNLAGIYVFVAFLYSRGTRRLEMQRIKLGKSDLEVPVICLGGNVFGWTLSEPDSLRQLDAALEAGLNFIDTTMSTHAGRRDIKVENQRPSSASGWPRATSAAT
jgi:hypothetical protein